MSRSGPTRAALSVLLSAALGAGLPGAVAQTATVVTPVAASSILMVAPKGFDAAPGFANGCWLKLYDGVAYVGDQLTLVGPIDLPRMTRTGAPWRDWDSAVVGAQARVTVYDAEGFEEHEATLEPRQRVPDMSLAGFGAFHDIESARVHCSAS